MWSRPLTHPTIHPWVGVCLQITKSSNRIERSQLGQDLIFNNMTWPHPLTHWTTNPPTHLPCMGCLYKSQIFKQNWIILIRSRLIQLLFIWCDPTHWPTQPSTHGWGYVYKSQIFKQNWTISIRSRFIWYLIIWPDPTHWPTEPPIHPHTYHAWGVSTNHKSLNRIELSRLGQDLFNC